MDIHKFGFFIDQGNRVSPKLTDDWVLGASFKEGNLNISSQKLNLSFNIPDGQFLLNSLRLNIQLSSNNTLIGSFIFSKKREIFDEYEYREWLSECNRIKRDSIKKSKLLKGSLYLLEDKSEVYFLGTKYISTFKGVINKALNKTELTKEMFTPISKRYLFSDERNAVFEIHSKIILEKLEGSLSQSKINKMTYKFHAKNPFIAYFRDDCPIIKKYLFDSKHLSFFTEIEDLS